MKAHPLRQKYFSRFSHHVHRSNAEFKDVEHISFSVRRSMIFLGSDEGWIFSEAKYLVGCKGLVDEA